MSASQPQIYCPNFNCAAPLNDFGRTTCQNCQTPLIYRYLWAVGGQALQQTVGTSVAGRYYVTAPQVWLDTQPGLSPAVSDTGPSEAMLPYLYLYPYRIHLPELYGVCPASRKDAAEILLLENEPLDPQGNLYPAIAQAWSGAPPVRQLYWLWQLLQLWSPLAEQGVAASLLAANNIRVQGWRVRLCQLIHDSVILPDAANTTTEVSPLGLSDLANLWLSWIANSSPGLQESLTSLCQAMQAPAAEVTAIAQQLNQLLLEQAAQLPLRLHLVGATDPGPQYNHNEDTCYPLLADTRTADGLLPHLAVVCDGIGGHEGGEVASQLAVQSIKMQVQALLTEVAAESEPVEPAILMEQLATVARVANNLIAAQNDVQEREARRRMGTTLMMAVQLPQRVRLSNGALADNGHELYLVSVGDSRAYWLTPRDCHRLTVDDDVAAREVRRGRSLYREALQRPDAGSLTQALGTRDADFLHPTVQRFILEEDGILLLCSDGLSDNGWVESAWQELTESVLRGKQSLTNAAQAWIDLANEKNGHDNVSVVLMRCYVSSSQPEVSLPDMGSAFPTADWGATARPSSETDQLAEPEVPPAAKPIVRSHRWRTTLLGLLIVLLASGIGATIWAYRYPGGFRQLWERIQPPSP